MSDQVNDQRTSRRDTTVSPFDAIKHEDADGAEYWSARELARLLGYTEYGKFRGAIVRAESACEASDHAASDHFAHVSDMITVGKGARRRVEDVRLSRYACYLIVQNADPEKPIVALGQTYFAVQTRRQELADERLLQGMSEDQRRLFVRDQLAQHNRSLADAAAGAGVISPRDFAVFQDHGFMGLYGGERARDIAARKGLKPGQRILDHMGSTELAANLFRATQTDEKLRREDIEGKDAANATHHAVGRAVRKTIAELGGAMPEDLPTPAEPIQQVRRKEQARAAPADQPSFFGAVEDEECDE